jgi:WD40 repeat protein
MTENEAIALVTRLLEGRRLTTVQKIVFEQSWEGKKYSDMGIQEGYELGYIKDVGSGLWRSLSKALNEKVTKNNLYDVLQRFVEQQEEAQKTAKLQTINARINWGEAIDVSIFYGRSEELTKLKLCILQEHCRIITIIGMGGMGKTSFAIKLAEEIQNEFDFVIWRSLRDTMPIDEYLTTLIKFFSQQQETELPDNTGGKISRLIELLKRSRCLMILDNFETILQDGKQAGVYRKGYEMYGELLKRIGEISHQSCLIVTSREKSQEIALMESDHLFVRTIPLAGLDIDAGQHILDDKGLHTVGDDLEQLRIYYRGNPLALKMAANAIQDLFAGDISQFLQQGNFAFNGIGKLIRQQCDRLSKLEQSIMSWLAINREPVTIADLQMDLAIELPLSRLIEAVESLLWRSLIESSALGFTLQPVVMESVTESLIESVVQEILSEQPQLLLSHALIKAQSKDYIRDSQIRVILKPLCDRLFIEVTSPQKLVQKLNCLLTHLQTNYAKQPNYGAGNLLNLFRQLQTDITGYDFSQLNIRQAYLQDVNLHHMNFTEADFHNCTFASTFGGITSVAFSPDGEQLATSDTNGVIHIWNSKDGKQLATCMGHNSWVWSVAYSPTQPILASCGQDHEVRLWNSQTGQLLKVMTEHTGVVTSVTFSADGQWLASTSGDQTVRIWNVEGEIVQTLYGHDACVWSATFHPDGQTIFSAGEDNLILRWNIANGECIQTLADHQAWVRTIAISPDLQYLVSGSFDKTLKIWNIATGNCLATLIGHKQPITSVAISADSQTIASSSYDQTVKLWCIESKQCWQTLQRHTNFVWSVAFHPTQPMLASGGEDHTARLWNMRTGQCTTTIQGYSNSIYSIAVSTKHQLIASGHEDQTIKLWKLDRQSLTDDTLPHYPFQTLRGHAGRVLSVAFSADEQILASGSPDHTVKLWNPHTGDCLRTLRGHISWVWAIAFHPNSKLIASVSYDHSIRIWDVETGDCLQTFKDHASAVLAVAFSPDGKWLVTGGYQQTIKLWNPETWECIHTLTAHLNRIWAIAFSPDSRFFATGGDDHQIRLWDVETRECLIIYTGHTNQIVSLLFSADGKSLISSSADRTIRIWNLTTNECTSILHQHEHWVWSLSQVLDNDTDQGLLLSSSQDATIKVWNLQDRTHLKTLHCPLPYEKSIITNATGLTEAQKMTWKALGAIV